MGGEMLLIANIIKCHRKTNPSEDMGGLYEYVELSFMKIEINVKFLINLQNRRKYENIKTQTSFV